MIHSGRIDAREIGAKGGRARGKGKRGSFREAVRDVLASDPVRHAERLLGSGAAGYQLADRLISEEEAREKATEAGPLTIAGHKVVSFNDMVALMYREAQAHLFGLPTTIGELEALLATAEASAPETRRSPKESGWNDPDTSSSPDEQQLPKVGQEPSRLENKTLPEVEELPRIETDADVDVLPSLDARRSLDGIARYELRPAANLATTARHGSRRPRECWAFRQPLEDGVVAVARVGGPFSLRASSSSGRLSAIPPCCFLPRSRWPSPAEVTSAAPVGVHDADFETPLSRLLTNALV